MVVVWRLKWCFGLDIPSMARVRIVRAGGCGSEVVVCWVAGSEVVVGCGFDGWEGGDKLGYWD